MSNSRELFLRLVGDEPDEAMAPLFMEHLLNQGMDHIPELVQTGMKNGQTLKAHIQNVSCFAYQIADIVELDDSEKLNLLAACYVHDLNKFPEYQDRSYDSIANSDNVRKILDAMLADSEYEFALSIDPIVSVIRAHSGHLHVDGDSLFASSQGDQSRKKQIGVIQIADILDLSHEFHERDQKEKALRILNGLLEEYQFEFTWHYFSDNRGIYTNLVHNAIVELYKRQGAIPLLFYPQGVWYLIQKGKKAKVSARMAADALHNHLNQMSMDDPSKALQYAKVGFKYTQNPFELNMAPTEVIDLLVRAILDRKENTYHKKYDDLSADSGKKRFKAYQDWLKSSQKRAEELKKAESRYEKQVGKVKLKPDFSRTDPTFMALQVKKQEQVRKARDKFEKAQAEVDLDIRFQSDPLWEKEPQDLFSPDIEALRSGDLVGSFALLLNNHLPFDSEKAWENAARIAGLKVSDYPELRFFNNQSDKGFRIAALLYQHDIGFESVKEAYTAWIESYLAQNQSRFASQADPEIIQYMESNLRNPGSSLKAPEDSLCRYMNANHKQCCHCGNGNGLELMAGDLPRGIKPQLFSNRLKGGGGDPKRNVCKICQQSFLTEKLVHQTYKNHYYLHLFSDGGEHSSHAEPGIFLESLKNGILDLQQTDCRSFLIQPGQTIKEYLSGKTPRVYGFAKKQMGLLAPKFSQSIGGQISLGINPPGENEGTRFSFALFHLLILCQRFNLRGILSRSAIPSLKAEDFGKIFIEYIPLSFSALIQKNNLDSRDSQALWKRFTSLYGLRNTYDMMEDKEITSLVKTLYDSSGLDLFHHLKKAYGRSQKTREKDIKPWNRAWPYLKLFINEEELMPIKELAQIALDNHFHGKSWNETSQAKPLDLAFDALSKHRDPETQEDLKMVILHDVIRGLERLSNTNSLGKERDAAARDFANRFFEKLFKERYKGDPQKMIKDQKRIRSAFLGYLTVLRDKQQSKQ